MNKKPDNKVEEPAAPYIVTKQAAKGSAKAVVRTADDAAFKRAADKIFSERKELLHKLAQ